MGKLDVMPDNMRSPVGEQAHIEKKSSKMAN